MDLLGILVLLVVVAVVAFLCHWVITSFFPEPARTPALAIVGLLLLLILLAQFFPGAANYRIWK